MGLSAFAINLRRRFTPPQQNKKLAPPRQTKSFDPLSPRRLKNLPLTDLLTHLLTLQTPIPQDSLSIIAKRLSTDSLPDLVSILTAPSVASPESRETYPNAWVAATLISHGPAQIRDALAERPELIRQLVDVFAVEQGALPPYRANLVADVLRVIVHENPKTGVAAVYKTDLPIYLVKHVGIQPAADLLAKLVAAKVFSPLPAPPLVPLHKKSIAMLGAAKVQDKLAKAFLQALEEVKGVKCARRKELALVLGNAANAMAEISNRAMNIPRKAEDADERIDVGYAGNLGIVTSHVFNDAKDHLTLLKYPQPLLNVVEGALDTSEQTVGLVPALSLAVHVMAAWRESKASPIPSVKKAIAKLDGMPLGEGLARLSGDFVKLLVNGDKLGKERMLAVDLVREFCETMPEQCVSDLLEEDDDLLLNEILEVGLRFVNIDQLQVRVLQIVHAVFSRFEELTFSILVKSNVLDFLMKRRESPIILQSLSALSEHADKTDKLEGARREQFEMLQTLVEFYNDRKAELNVRSLTRAKTGRVTVSSDMIKELDLDGDVIGHEEYGQELYLHALLDEIRHGANQVPPSDSHVAHKAADITSGWDKGLSGRLKSAYHHYK